MSPQPAALLPRAGHGSKHTPGRSRRREKRTGAWKLSQRLLRQRCEEFKAGRTAAAAIE